MAADQPSAADLLPDAERSASERIYEKWPHGKARPSVRSWMPETVPFARCGVIAGCGDRPDTLPLGPVTAYLTLGGIEFGGYLTDLELQLEAAQEALAYARSHAEHLGAMVATEGYHKGYLVRVEIDGREPEVPS